MLSAHLTQSEHRRSVKNSAPESSESLRRIIVYMAVRVKAGAGGMARFKDANGVRNYLLVYCQHVSPPPS